LQNVRAPTYALSLLTVEPSNVQMSKSIEKQEYLGTEVIISVILGQHLPFKIFFLQTYFNCFPCRKELNWSQAQEVYSCNPNARRLRQEDDEFNTSLDYTTRLCLINKKKKNH
jgi:hypothetical protein